MMMKKLWGLLLCLCVLLGCLAACGPAGNTAAAPDAGTVGDTAAEGDTTAPETTGDPVTEADTTAAETTPEMNQDEVDRMNAMLNAREGKLLPIGGWATPATDLRDHNTGVEGSYDKAFRLLADAGLTYMITLEEWSSGSWPVESLSSAKKAGMQLWFNCAGQSPAYSMERINAMLSSEAADALATVYVKDEPTIGQITETADAMNAIRAALGDQKLPVMANLLPTYASSDMVTKDYRGYVRTYLDAAKPDRLMFDHYPFQGAEGDTLPAMLANIAIAREEADKDGIELYTFLQSSGWPGIREPSVEELRVNAHLNLAMGVKGFAYFLTCEHYEGWDYSSMLTAKGETTPLYDKVKTVNAELGAFEGIFLDYTYKGTMIVSYDEAEQALRNKQCTSLLESFGSVTEVATLRRSKAVIGCFADADGHEAYYVVNAEYTHSNKVTLTLDRAQSYIIWTKEGPAKLENTDTVTLSLDSGDAAFVIKFDVNS